MMAGLLDPDDLEYLAEQRRERVARVIELHPDAWEVIATIAAGDGNPMTYQDESAVIEIAVFMMSMISANPDLMIGVMKMLVMVDEGPLDKYHDKITEKIVEHETRGRRN